MGVAERTAEEGAVTATGFSVTGFSNGGQADALERSAIGFLDRGFPNSHRV
ncbi:MAG: hypothetical protein ACI4PC_04745 [Oscillospiraceae bacterium]